MVKIDLDEQKRIELGLLKNFCRLCQEHNLSFFLTYGTLIGAVRHKGFIPWDDDIDVMMPRPDYNRLVELFSDKIVYEHCSLLTPLTMDYIYAFSKFVDTRTSVNEPWMLTNILGVYIDVFPIDGVPKDDVIRKKFIRKIMNLHYFLLISSRKNKSRKTLIKTLVSKILYYPLRFIGYKKFVRCMCRLCQKYDYTSSDCVGILSIDTYLKKEFFPKKIFEETTYLDFEGAKMPVPKGYHEYLTKIYGDYMQLPPVEQRKCKHESSAFWNK